MGRSERICSSRVDGGAWPELFVVELNDDFVNRDAIGRFVAFGLCNSVSHIVLNGRANAFALEITIEDSVFYIGISAD